MTASVMAQWGEGFPMERSHKQIGRCFDGGKETPSDNLPAIVCSLPIKEIQNGRKIKTV